MCLIIMIQYWKQLGKIQELIFPDSRISYMKSWRSKPPPRKGEEEEYVTVAFLPFNCKSQDKLSGVAFLYILLTL